MTKGQNRVAAKAFAEEKEREYQRERRQRAVAADLDALGKLRNYLIFNRQFGEPPTELMSALDDYVEKLTGDRRTLHAQHYSIGR